MLLRLNNGILVKPKVQTNLRFMHCCLHGCKKITKMINKKFPTKKMVGISIQNAKYTRNYVSPFVSLILMRTYRRIPSKSKIRIRLALFSLCHFHHILRCNLCVQNGLCMKNKKNERFCAFTFMGILHFSTFYQLHTDCISVYIADCDRTSIRKATHFLRRKHFYNSDSIILHFITFTV